MDQVPVVRVYGATAGGQKTCLHLHKVSLRTETWALLTAFRQSQLNDVARLRCSSLEGTLGLLNRSLELRVGSLIGFCSSGANHDTLAGFSPFLRALR